MWTFKNLLAVGLFLFGSTFLWMTPAFAGKTPPPTGTARMFASVQAVPVAAWGVFKQSSWWETTALVSGVVGLVAVVPFIVGQSQLDVGLGDPGVQINLWLHLLGSAAVIAIVLLPVAHNWVTRRL